MTNLAASVTRSWTDANNNFVPDCNLLTAQTNGECGTISDLTFGTTKPSASFDPAALSGFNVRPGNWELSTGIQHQLIPRVGLNVGYFRRVYTNFVVTDNRATAASDYTTFGLTAPVDPRLPGGGGYQIGGFTNLNPNKVGQVDNYTTFSSNYGSQLEHWNGLDASIDVRLPAVRLQGGVSSGRTATDNCDISLLLPEILLTASQTQCHQDTKFLTQGKLLATYTIPRVDVQVAGTLQSSPGVPITAASVALNATVQPSLGRPCQGQPPTPR